MKFSPSIHRYLGLRLWVSDLMVGQPMFGGRCNGEHRPLFLRAGGETSIIHFPGVETRTQRPVLLGVY
jgi:hypothetical protein